MTAESAFIQSLRALAADPAARGLFDDAAVLEIGGTRLVLTHDMIIEGVHFLSDDPPEDVAFKLVAVNLSDLAAKGAEPVGMLLGYSLATEGAWDEAFARGLGSAIERYGVPLLGGDTVAAPPRSPRALGLTAIGKASGPVPSRAGARPGDALWVSGSIGDTGVGLRIALGQLAGPETLLQRYRRPEPRLGAGRRLAPLVTAMMDVSDGLLIDAARMASASGAALGIDLGSIPLSAAFAELVGTDRSARLEAATAGDDYELLFAAPEASSADISSISKEIGVSLTRIGRFAAGSGVRLLDGREDVPLPDRLGWEHQPR